MARTSGWAGTGACVADCLIAAVRIPAKPRGLQGIQPRMAHMHHPSSFLSLVGGDHLLVEHPAHMAMSVLAVKILK